MTGEIKGILINRLYRDVTLPARPPPTFSQWQRSLSSTEEDHSRLFDLVNHLCNQCNWSSSEWPRSKARLWPRLPRLTPGSSSKHKSKNLPLVWPSADNIWKIKWPFLAYKGNKTLQSWADKRCWVQWNTGWREKRDHRDHFSFSVFKAEPRKTGL